MCTQASSRCRRVAGPLAGAVELRPVVRCSPPLENRHALICAAPTRDTHFSTRCSPLWPCPRVRSSSVCVRRCSRSRCAPWHRSAVTQAEAYRSAPVVVWRLQGRRPSRTSTAIGGRAMTVWSVRGPIRLETPRLVPSPATPFPMLLRATPGPHPCRRARRLARPRPMPSPAPPSPMLFASWPMTERRSVAQPPSTRSRAAWCASRPRMASRSVPRMPKTASHARRRRVKSGGDCVRARRPRWACQARRSPDRGAALQRII